MQVARCYLVKLILISVISILLWVLYTIFIQPMNAYLYMHSIELSFNTLAIWLIWISVTAFIIPSSLTKPSDFLLLTYGVFVLMGSSVMWASSGLLEPRQGILLLSLLIIPLISCYLLAEAISVNMVRYFGGVRLPFSLHYNLTVIALIIVAASLGVYLLGEGSFGMEDSYERRLLARELMPTGVLSTYLFSMVLNGVAPFAAYIGVTQRQPMVLLFGAGFVILAYWLLGTKAPILVVIFCAVLGYLANKGALPRLPFLLLVFIASLVVLSCLEYVFFNYSYISDYFLRRAFSIVGQVQGAYVAYAFEHMTFKDIVFGIEQLDRPISMLVGQWYYLNPATNANTNTVLHTLLSKGLVGVVIAVLVISVVFALFNYLFTVCQTGDALVGAFIYALLLAEQNYTIALLSSGIFLVLLLITFHNLSQNSINDATS